MKRKWRRLLWTLAALLVVSSCYVWFFGIQTLMVMEARSLGRRSPFVRMTPKPLPDSSVSSSTAVRLSYFGYDFDIPWNGLDESRTRKSPNHVVLYSNAGQIIMINSAPPKEFVKSILDDTNRKSLRQIYGDGTLQSDYALQSMILHATPDQLSILSSRKDAVAIPMLLIIKAISAPEESGIFDIQTKEFRGFQWGDLQRGASKVVVELLGDDGGLEFTFACMRNAPPFSQAEINRVLQSVTRRPERRGGGHQELADLAE